MTSANKRTITKAEQKKHLQMSPNISGSKFINNVSMRDKNRYGDEYVILKISVPKRVSVQEKELLQKFKNIEERKPA